jgi:putative phosphoesterase
LPSHLIGVIADTHGLLRPEALAALRGCELLLHAGDAGKPEVLESLRRLAPLHAVRGNIDRGSWAEALPLSEVVEVGEKLLYLYHGHLGLDLDPAAAGFAAVISGHSHRPSIAERSGVLYLNPGSAGPRRFSLPVTLAHLTIFEGRLEANLVELL